MKRLSIYPAVINQTASDWLRWLNIYNQYTNPRPLNQEESLALRDAIINPDKGYERVAEAFFFFTIKPLVCKIAYMIRKTYLTEVKPVDISAIIYREFWDYGRFSRLIDYKGECSLFSWIARGAAQVVYAELERMGTIKMSRKLNAKNTSLRLKSLKDKNERKVIIDIVTEPRWHGILTELYVERTPSEMIMQKLGMDDIAFKKTVRKAEAALKNKLIATETMLWHRPGINEGTTVNLVSIALGDASGKLNTLPSDETLILTAEKLQDTDIKEDIADVLRLKYPDLDPESMLEHFVKDQALVCGMTDNQLQVWTARYINHESPVSVAARLGIRRANVDNLYSRANRLLEKHLRHWWLLHS